MRKFLALTCASFVLGLVGYAIAGVPQAADDGFCIKNIPALTSAAAVRLTPVYIADPTCSNPNKVKSVCLFNASTAALEVSYFASEDTVDDTKGWPVFGSMDRCYDVGPNFSSWAFRGDGQPDAGLKVMYLK